MEIFQINVFYSRHQNLGTFYFSILREVFSFGGGCLFNRGFSSHSRIFHSFETVTITDEGLQILTYARHSWPLGSLTFYTYCNIWANPLNWPSTRTHDTHTCCRAFGSGAVTTCFTDSRPGIEPCYPAFEANAFFFIQKYVELTVILRSSWTGFMC